MTNIRYGSARWQEAVSHCRGFQPGFSMWCKGKQRETQRHMSSSPYLLPHQTVLYQHPFHLCFIQVIAVHKLDFLTEGGNVQIAGLTCTLVLSVGTKFTMKHRKNCECCPGHSLIVNH